MKRTILVTGANRGIGLAIARELAELGHSVWLGSRNFEEGRRIAESLSSGGLDVLPLHLDLNDPESMAGAVNRVRESGRHVDGLVNNAGVLYEKTLLELTDDEISDTFSVHLTGPIRLIRAFVPGMIQRGYGRIVNMSSNWGSFAQGMGGPGVYGVTKAALNALTVRLAKELPSTVKVNAMDPGWVRTRMGGAGAARSPEEAAKTAVWLATLPDDGPNGGFFRDQRAVNW